MTDATSLSSIFIIKLFLARKDTKKGDARASLF
jgi:hypothetical protein